MAITTLTNENFEREVLQAEQPVLVDFYATWCGPCKMLAPVIEQVAEEAADAKICKLDVDACGEIAQRYGISSVPTLICFKNGQVLHTAVGVQSKYQILDMLKQ